MQASRGGEKACGRKRWQHLYTMCWKWWPSGLACGPLLWSRLAAGLGGFKETDTEHAGPCPTTQKVLKTNEQVKDVQVVSSCVFLGGRTLFETTT